MKKKSPSKYWLIASILGATISVVGYVYVATTSTSYNSGNERAGMLSGIIAVISFVAVVLAFTAAFQTKQWQRVVPILSILISLVIFSLAIFAWGFSGYGSSS